VILSDLLFAYALRPRSPAAGGRRDGCGDKRAIHHCASAGDVFHFLLGQLFNVLAFVALVFLRFYPIRCKATKNGASGRVKSSEFTITAAT
jgi:hypothetical protein